MVMLEDVRFVGNGSEVHCNVTLKSALTSSHPSAQKHA
jgi:hypothetical protein